MFQRILVPLDGSPRAEQVLPVAARVARASGATITLLHVVESSHTSVSYGAMNPLLTQDAIKSSLSSARNYLESMLLRPDLAGVSLEPQVVMGHPAMVILSILDEQAIDLIILSSHGYTGVKRWLLGSIAEKVARAAPAPVLLLRGGEPLRTHVLLNGTRVVRALIPLDTSARALEAIAPAAALVAAFSSPGQGELHLIQIIVLPEEVSEGERETLLQGARQNLQVRCEQVQKSLLATFGLDLHPVLNWSISLEQDSAEGIIRIAEHGEKATETGGVESSDLLAMTTHGSGGYRRWTMGSITERVLYATKLPLLLVRPADMIARARQEQENTVTSESPDS